MKKMSNIYKLINNYYLNISYLIWYKKIKKKKNKNKMNEFSESDFFSKNDIQKLQEERDQEVEIREKLKKARQGYYEKV